MRAFVDAARGRDVRVLINDAGRQVLAVGINAFVGGHIGTEDRSFVQGLPDGEDFAVVNDHVRLFELARFFTGPYRRPFEPDRALSRPFDVAVGYKRIHDFALHRIGLSLVRQNFFLRLALSNGAPFDPRTVGSLSTPSQMRLSIQTLPDSRHQPSKPSVSSFIPRLTDRPSGANSTL